MNIATYARRNLFRRRWRTILTLAAITVTVLIFCLIRTVVVAWNAGAAEASQDRLAARHKVSFTMQLPLKYAEETRQIPGVKSATWANWFGVKDPKKRVPFFAGFAGDKDSWFETVTEMQVEAQQLAEWKKSENKNGVIIGDVLSEKLEAPVGSEITLESDIYPGQWKFKVIGIYKPLRKTVDRLSMVMRWDYLNDWLRENPRNGFPTDQIGWLMINITDPEKSGEISQTIDKHFETQDDQTITMSERAFQLQFLGTFSAVLDALDAVSLFILLIMMLILANTVSMNVRERSHEYGVMRAIGFPPSYVAGFIIGESMLVALLGGLIGVLFVWLLINNVVGPAIETFMPGLFPYFRTPGVLMGIALIAAAIVGAIAGLIPAIGASRLKVTDALRRVD